MKDDVGHGLLGDVHGDMVGGLLSAEALSPVKGEPGSSLSHGEPACPQSVQLP